MHHPSVSKACLIQGGKTEVHPTRSEIKVAVIENVNSINATHLMVTQVKLQNGNVTAVVTLIDSSLWSYFCFSRKKIKKIT